MQFDQEETLDSVELLVRRCAFHQFFVEHGEPALTRVFCEWDRNWMDIVNEPGARFELNGQQRFRQAAIAAGSGLFSPARHMSRVITTSSWCNYRRCNPKTRPCIAEMPRER